MAAHIFHIGLVVMVSLASAAISFTITTTSIFKWLRELISPIHHKFEELIHCPWCLSHYVSLVLVIVFLREFPIIYMILLWFAIQGLVGLFHYVLLRAYEPVARAMAQRMIEKLRKDHE